MLTTAEKEAYLEDIAKRAGVGVKNVKAVIYADGFLSVENKRYDIISEILRDEVGVFLCLLYNKFHMFKSRTRLSQLYLSELTQGIHTHIRGTNYQMEILVANTRIADNAYFEKVIATHPPIAIIDLIAKNSVSNHAVCHEKNTPYIMIDHPSEPIQPISQFVSIDAKRVIKDVVSHLYSLGHRDIAFIQGEQDFLSAIQRYEGYLEALSDLGIPVNEDYIVRNANWEDADGYNAGKQLLGLNPRPTAIVSSNDWMAIGVLRATVELGIEVPKDLSLVGFDNVDMATTTTPMLSTVAAPIMDIGRQAAEMAVSLLEGILPKSLQLYLPLEYIVRDSTGPVPEDR